MLNRSRAQRRFPDNGGTVYVPRDPIPNLNQILGDDGFASDKGIVLKGVIIRTEGNLSPMDRVELYLQGKLHLLH